MKDIEKAEQFIAKHEGWKQFVDSPTPSRVTWRYVAALMDKFAQQYHKEQLSKLPSPNYDIHNCINEICEGANGRFITVGDAKKDNSFRYRVKKAIDAMVLKMDER